jgi:hypothetical protein
MQARLETRQDTPDPAAAAPVGQPQVVSHGRSADREESSGSYLVNRVLVHLTHCNMGEHSGGCKYGNDDECPALSDGLKWMGQRIDDGVRMKRAMGVAERAGRQVSRQELAQALVTSRDALRSLSSAIDTEIGRIDSVLQDFDDGWDD